MRRALTGLTFIALLSCVIAGQAPAPAFDAADVHLRPRTSNANPQMSGGVLRGGRYDLRNATMVDLIAMAYSLNPDRVLGGPNWLERDRFDIIAKAPQTTSPDSVNLMLQGLLAERFKLVLHKETKPQPGYALTLGGGRHKLKEANDSGESGCQGQPQPPPEPGVIPYTVVSCHKITMQAFAEQLRAMAGAYLDASVTDLTGLKGAWDFDLKWTARAALAQAGADGIPISDALDKQLGLRLEPRQMPTPVLLVDSVNQTPAPNPSGAAQNLPAPPPAEFDVADIKLSPPDAMMPMGRLQPGGRINLQGFTLRMLITLAWDINDDELLAGPKFIDDTRVSAIARVSGNAIGGATNGPPIDIDDVRAMMRALLIDRFKMTTHVEDRPVTAYKLVADKPKLTKADPANRTNWRNGPAPNARDPRNSNPILSRLVTCRNMTMAQFAEDLPRIAPGYIRTPVVDATGLEGNWDFTFNFSPNGVPQGGTGAGDGRQPAGLTPAAADPSGALTLFEALSKQLGLKLEVEKRPLPVLVIDHMEQKPTDN